MALDTRKYAHKHTHLIRDIRPLATRIADWLLVPTNSFVLFLGAASVIYMYTIWADVVFVAACLYFWWLRGADRSLAFKMPLGANFKDARNMGPGRNGRPEGILYLGNVDKTNEEVWFTNSDARTHILYLGTTGAGKTEGLKAMVTNALTWGSGFVYVDGKADTDLWSSLSSLCRRFGRDDDLLVLNYMTGNSDAKAPSNTLNPFSSGSASYLTNMLVSLMPDAQGDNAMWKERAVALVSSLMPALTWKRDNQEMPLSVSTIRQFLTLPNVIKICRDEAIPERIRTGVRGYLDTLPGFVDEAFDDNGQVKPPGPDVPMVDTSTCFQQHGYLAMQFTRSLQSLGDDYGYIFDTQAADVEMVDVVLNRRVLVVLIPALEKSADETANLGKIVAATMKGMMGSTLGATVEGESAAVIENKPTKSSTPFMTVFDEVGYYAAQGMAVMAAQARSLGFCLIYSAQDLPAMEKRVKEEARSITANCNIKLFGKLEDPTQTKEFFEKTVGSSFVTEVSGFQTQGGTARSYFDTKQAGVQLRPNASYDGLKSFKEGQSVVCFGEMVVDTQIFYANPGHAKAMRVTRYMELPPPDDTVFKHAKEITKLRDLMVNKSWTALKADVETETPDELAALAEGFLMAQEVGRGGVDAGICALAAVHALHNHIDFDQIGAPAAPVSPALESPLAQAAAALPAPDAGLAATPFPLETRQAAEPVPAQTAPGGGPMSFFSKKPTAEQPAAPAAPGPISWQELVNTPQEDPAGPLPAEPMAIPAETRAAPFSSTRVNPVIEDILRSAGREAGERLNRQSDTDAAE